jgi:hypothetical protein
MRWGENMEMVQSYIDLQGYMVNGVRLYPGDYIEFNYEMPCKVIWGTFMGMDHYGMAYVSEDRGYMHVLFPEYMFDIRVLGRR